MKIISWNVNGLNACRRKGFDEYLLSAKPDFFCCQEVKAHTDFDLPNYFQYWNLCESKKGYSGTLTLAKKEAISVQTKLGNEMLDVEGRMIALEYDDFILINVYVPNMAGGLERKEYRAEWDVAFRSYVCGLEKPVIICGDFNVARDTKDIYPENLHNIPNPPGFQPDEREAMERLLKDAELFDVFRTIHSEKISYTWWSNRRNKRRENRGWRLDYFLISKPLIGDVTSIRHRAGRKGSDHCPVELKINLWHPKAVRTMTDENRAEMWRGIDWSAMEQQLLILQQKLTKAAYAKDEEQCFELQKKIVRSMAAKALAVRHVVNQNSAPGIDNVRWTTDEEKMQAVLSLTSKGYHARPYRQIVMEVKGKERHFNIPTAYDKAMQTLYAYSLDPIAEATAESRSCAFRKGRSTYDCNSFICELFDAEDAPEWVFRGDVKSCYESISHKWLLKNIPMDRKVLFEFLRAGAVMNGTLFPLDQGISLGGSLSPIIGNMTLDGMQDYIFDRLYPDGNIDPLQGAVVRFADDFVITARSREKAQEIRGIVMEFLISRGLRLSEEKSKIASIDRGFEFLSRWYYRSESILMIKPSHRSVVTLEDSLEEYILGYKGSIQPFIEGLNRKLGAWGRYHRITDAYEEFKHIDNVVQSLLLKKMRQLHPKRQLSHITSHYWYRDAKGDYIFSVPEKRQVRVIHLADMHMVPHYPIRPNFNPYLDQDYYNVLVRRREINKVNSAKYQAVWQRQQGKCHFCGQEMLSDHELETIKLNPNGKSTADNLVYVHKRCAQLNGMEFLPQGNPSGLNVMDTLEDVMEENFHTDDPYWALRVFFHNSKKSPITLTFDDIEEIIGDSLDWEAYFCEAFWYDQAPGFLSELWDKDYPFHAVQTAERRYCIAEAWLSQGYIIQRLRMAERRVIFRKKAHGVSGVNLPDEVFNRKLPKDAVYEIEEFVKVTLKKYGIRT